MKALESRLNFLESLSLPHADFHANRHKRVGGEGRMKEQKTGHTTDIL